jgi:hypothetical protein
MNFGLVRKTSASFRKLSRFRKTGFSGNFDVTGGELGVDWGEQARARTEADPCGMTNKGNDERVDWRGEKANSRFEGRGDGFQGI